MKPLGALNAIGYGKSYWYQGSGQLKTHLRCPGKILRTKRLDLIRQEIYGYLLTHYAISALLCRAATEADIDPDRISFKRTVRIIRREAASQAAFPLTGKNTPSRPSWPKITSTRRLNPRRRTGPTPASSSEPATAPTA